MRPLLLRPPFFVTGASSDFSGSFLVISAKSETVMKRRPGDVGLYLRTAISVQPRDVVGWVAREKEARGGRRTGTVLCTPLSKDDAWRRFAAARRQPMLRG